MMVIGNKEILQKALDKVFKKLRVEVAASNRCTSKDQCAEEPTGNSPCGGASGSVAYSTVNANSVQKIKELARKTRTYQTAINHYDKIHGLPRGCAGLPGLVVACKDRKCQLVAAGSEGRHG